MRIATCFAALVLLFAGMAGSFAAVTIEDDRGGRIGTYIDKFEGIRDAGETVVIDGLCASACTIVLGAVPHERICVTPRAHLGFHAAWDPGPNGAPVPNRVATEMLYSLYPETIQRWINHQGGLTPKMIFLEGEELTLMFTPCYTDASATRVQ